MTKKLETMMLISSLEKAHRKTKKMFWKALAESIKGPSRGNVAVNLEKINLIAKSKKAKAIIVPGKVLSDGELEEKVKVVAISASKMAVWKIMEKGEFVYLKDYAKNFEKAKLSEVIIIK